MSIDWFVTRRGPPALTCERLALPDLLPALDTVEDSAAYEEISDGDHDQTQRPHVLLLHLACIPKLFG